LLPTSIEKSFCQKLKKNPNQFFEIILKMGKSLLILAEQQYGTVEFFGFFLKEKLY